MKLILSSKTIIRLTALYCALRAVFALYIVLGEILVISKKGANQTTVLILTIGIIVAFILLVNAWGLARFRAWSRRTTLIICGVSFIMVVLSGISSNGLANFSVLSLMIFILDGAIISVFLRNKDIHSTLGQKKDIQ